MNTQLNSSIPASLETCKLPWLPDSYFVSLAEARASSGAPGAPRPKTQMVGAAGGESLVQATEDVQIKVAFNCRSLFLSEKKPDGSETLHGDLLSQITLDLDSIIYREGREAPLAK